MSKIRFAIRCDLCRTRGPGTFHAFPELQADPQFMAWFAGWRSK